MLKPVNMPLTQDRVMNILQNRVTSAILITLTMCLWKHGEVILPMMKGNQT